MVTRDSKVHKFFFFFFFFFLLLLLLLLLLFIPWEFFTTSALTDGSHWCLNDSKSPQVSRTLLTIQADLNNAIVWMVSTLPFISKSSSLFINPLVTVPKIPITVGIIVTFMFHSFFISLEKSSYLSFFSFSFNFTLLSAGTGKSTILQILIFFKIIFWSGHLTEIKWSICMSKYQRSVVCHSWGPMLGCEYAISRMVKFIIIIIIIITYSLEFFTSALSEGLSLTFEWQQVSSSLQDSSQYSGHSS